MLTIALAVPDPTATQFFMFRVVLALAAAGFGAVIPGLISVSTSNVIRAGGAITLFVLVYLWNPPQLVFSHPPKEPVAKGGVEADKNEQDLLNLVEKRFALLWGSFEQFQRYGMIVKGNVKIPDDTTRFARLQINQEALRIAENLVSIDPLDSEIDLGRQIVKYEYAAYSYVIAASTASASERRLAFCDKALVLCKTALQKLQHAKSRPEIKTWVIDGDDEPRVKYVQAMALCMKGHELSRVDFQREASMLISTLPEAYVAKEPPAVTQELQNCIPGK